MEMLRFAGTDQIAVKFLLVISYPLNQNFVYNFLTFFFRGSLCEGQIQHSVWFVHVPFPLSVQIRAGDHCSIQPNAKEEKGSQR